MHSDTSPEVIALQNDIYRRMTPEARVRLAVEMSHFTRELALARIRGEHPEWTQRQVMGEWFRIITL